jgi:hypothetical protein
MQNGINSTGLFNFSREFLIFAVMTFPGKKLSIFIYASRNINAFLCCGVSVATFFVISPFLAFGSVAFFLHYLIIFDGKAFVIVS